MVQVKRMKWQSGLGMLLVCAPGFGWQVELGGHSFVQGDIVARQAEQSATEFADLVGFKGDFFRGSAYYGPNHGRRGRQRWILSANGLTVLVDARSGRVLSLWNEARIDDQNHHRHRTGKPLFTNRVRAKAYIEKLVARIGTPKGAVMKFSYNLEGTIKDQNASGQFGAVYIRNKIPVMTISCDIQDGVPVSITFG